MTVTVTSASSGPFTPNGATTVFPFTFAALSAAEVQVVRRAADGTDTVLAGYTVSITPTGGGSVTFSGAPAAGDPLYIFSDPDFTQQVTFANQGAWSPSAMNQALDRAAGRDIYLKEQTDRAIKAPYGEVGPAYPAADARAGRYLTHDDEGNIVPGPVVGDLADIASEIAADVAAAELSESSAVNAASLAGAARDATLTAIAGSGGAIGTISLQAATRAILQATHLPTSGLATYLSEKGYEGWFVFDSSNLSAKVTLDVAGGIYLAPTSASGLATNGSAGAWVRVIGPLAGFKAEWFGQKADGVWNGTTYTGTDDTVAIQRAIDLSFAIYTGTVFLKSSYSVIGGALQDTSFSNAQILFPNNTSVTQGKQCRLIGDTPPAAVVNESGAILCSTLTTGTGQCIGRTNSLGVSRIAVHIENVTIRLPQNSGNSGIDFSDIPFWTQRNVRYDVAGAILSGGGGAGALYVTVAKPTHTTNYGFKTSLSNVALAGVIDNVYVYGYYSGCLLGELVSGDNLYVSGCVYGLSFMVGLHPLTFGRMLVTNCCHLSRYVDIGLGGGGLEVQIATLDYEFDTVAGSGPAWVEDFSPRYDIDDAALQLRGNIHYVSYETIGLSLNGATRVKITRTDKANPLTPIFGGFLGQWDINGVSELRASKLNFSTLRSDIVNMTSTNQYAGGHWISNSQMVGPDFRLGGWTLKTQSSLGAGLLTLGISVNGSGTWTEPFFVGGGGSFFGPYAAGDHFIGRQGNQDMVGTVSLAAATSVTKSFATAYLGTPSVTVTPTSDLGSGVRFWVTASASGFTVNTSAAVTATFNYHVIGNGG